jgi:3-deoxy-7-phosphoheptulonate synthase
MQLYETDNLRINEIIQVVPASEIHAQFPITEASAKTVFETRRQIHDILHWQDDRLLVIIGPCSIHDPAAALEYAGRLLALKQELADDLLIVMRVYFEKPRTTVGWKGLINDPHLDESFRINEGVALARKLLLDVNSMGLPAGTEFLDLISPQYVADLVSWGAIGARTTESQGHRELASGLSCPVGFKNGTDGTMNIAVDAIGAAQSPHVFMSMTKAGHSAIFSTKGNEDTHVILRGGQRPNYDAESVDIAAQEMTKAGITPCLMIDFSHANSRKVFKKQLDVAQDVAGQISRGDKRIIGTMIESHLVEGNQRLETGKSLTYGQSITDACISWDDSVKILHTLAQAVQKRREQ